MAKNQRNTKNGTQVDHVAYYHTYKYNSLQRLNSKYLLIIKAPSKKKYPDR